MIQNRITQLIFRTVFLVLAFLGVIESFGLFAGQTPSLDCFLWYTSLSNFLCFGVMIAIWINTLKHIRKDQMRGHTELLVKIKFYSVIAILVTFIIYNFILEDNMFASGWNNLGNLTKHIFCPLLFFVDWLLFDKKKTLKWYDPLLTTIFPLVYATLILIRGTFLNPETYTGTIYPYFFLDVNELGFGGVLKWIVILLIAFIALGYLLFAYNRFTFKKKK